MFVWIPPYETYPFSQSLVLATGIVLLMSSMLVANHIVTHAALWHYSSFSDSKDLSLAISLILYLFSPVLYLFKLCLLFSLLSRLHARPLSRAAFVFPESSLFCFSQVI